MKSVLNRDNDKRRKTRLAMLAFGHPSFHLNSPYNEESILDRGLNRLTLHVQGYPGKSSLSKICVSMWCELTPKYEAISNHLDQTATIQTNQHHIRPICFTESAHWADSVIKTACPFVCLSVCLSPPHAIFF